MLLSFAEYLEIQVKRGKVIVAIKTDSDNLVANLLNSNKGGN